MPAIGHHFFQRKLICEDDNKKITLSSIQKALLVGVSLQRKSFDDIEVFFYRQLAWIKDTSFPDDGFIYKNDKKIL